MPSSEETAAAPRWWRCIALEEGERPVWFALVRSERHADGETVVLPLEQAVVEVAGHAECTAHLDEARRVVRLEMTPVRGWTVPDLWYAEVPEPTATPPASNLIGFTGHGVAAGSLLGGAELREAGVDSADQVGAVRWYPETGEVDQVYVAPAWRRKRVASTLAAVSGTLNEARGLPRFWGDGQRTELGERWRNEAVWAHRGVDQTHVAPPMTPGDQA